MNCPLHPPQAFKVTEEEDLVSAVKQMWDFDGSASRYSELILAVFTLFDSIRVFEKVRSIKFIIAEKLPDGAVQFIGALFDRGIENGSSGPPKLCAEACGLDLEFLNGIDWGKNNKVRTIQEVHGVRIVVNAIEQIIVLRWPEAIGSEGAGGGIATRVGLRSVHARGELGQECEIPPV